MIETKIPNARTDKEKDAPEIIVMGSLAPMVLAGTAGFFLTGPIGAIIGAPLGAGLGALAAYRFVRRTKIAREMKTEISNQ